MSSESSVITPVAPPIDGGLHTSQHALLGRGLSTFSVVLMVVAAAAPLTVVAATVPVILTATGSVGLPLFFLSATVILLLFSVGFTRMSAFVKNAGAFYSYIKAGLGRIPGVGAATLALGSYFLLLTALYSALGVMAASAVSTFTGADLPWWLFAGIAWAFVALLGFRDIDLSAKVLGVALMIEALAVLILSVAIVVQGGAEGLNTVPLFPSDLTPAGFGFGLMFAVLGFIGFEATAVFRHEAKDPDKTIPRATFIAVIVIGLFYAISSWAIVMGAGVDGIWGELQADPANLVFNLAAIYVSPVLSNAMQILIVTSLFAGVLAFHNVIGRYMFTLGSFRVLPVRLGTVNARHRTPSFASVVLSAISIVTIAILALANVDAYTVAYTWFSGAATLGLLVLMALTNLAVIAFFRRVAGGGTWSTLVAPLLSLIGMGIVVYMVITNFDLLIGDQIAAGALLVLLAAFFVAGVFIATSLRTRNPAAYERLGASLEISAAEPVV